MKKRPLFLGTAVCVCLAAALLAGCGSSHKDEAAWDESTPLAEFHGEKVYPADVEYYQNMNQLFSAETGDTQTSQEILTEILQNMVLFDEAQRLGYAATQEEIDAMVENAKQAYSIPEGKEMMDRYFEEAGMTADQYFGYLEEQAPRVIARQKLLDAVGEQFCQENGLTFTKVNPPPELTRAKEDYVDQLFARAQANIIYYQDAG